MMCSNDGGVLTLDGLLRDPLTLMLMRSDGVSEREFSELMLRVQDSLVARQEAAWRPNYACIEVLS